MTKEEEELYQFILSLFQDGHIVFDEDFGSKWSENVPPDVLAQAKANIKLVPYEKFKELLYKARADFHD